MEETGTVDGGASNEIFEQLRTDAEKHGENLFRELHTKHQDGIHHEREKGRYAFHVRRQALNRIGLPEVRQFRIRKLDEEEREWQTALQQREHVFPELQPVCLLYVEGDDG